MGKAEEDKKEKQSTWDNTNEKMEVDAVSKEEEEKKEKVEPIDVSQLETGYYELCGVVTHKGRSANSGHYIGYSKDSARGIWLKFDDEDVTEIKADDVKQLYGGGDHQMAFLCMFRRIEPSK